MYSKVTARVKCREGYTNQFPIPVGTKQGCNLSPTLFNCYINDVVTTLDRQVANQPFLSGIKVSCLLFADDMILLSHSPQGLQKLISNLEQYCNKWQLIINTNKTKIMAIGKRKCDHVWRIYDDVIDKVSSFCYLGVEIDTKGSFKPGINRLYNKAHRAYMGVRENYNFYNGTPVNVLVKLFDCMIQPILTYGSELWGMYEWRKQSPQCVLNAILQKDGKTEKLHTIFCKQVLGMNKHTPG